MSQGVDSDYSKTSISTDLCLRCGYDLRGTADDQPCSECGLLAERSRSRSPYLSDCPPWLIRRLAIGSQLLLGAVLAVIGVVGAVPLAASFVNETIMLYVEHPVPHVFTVAVLSWVVGVFLLTTRGTAAHAASMPRRLSFAWRVAAIALLIPIVDMHADMLWKIYRWARSNDWVSSDWYAWISWALDVLAISFIWLVLSLNCLLGFLWLRRLAQRVLNSNLAEHSAIVGVGFAVSSGARILFAISEQWLEENQPLKNKTWMLLSMVFIAAVFACVIMCALWSLVNLIRFILAFRRAARESRQRWQQADRAVEAN